MLYMSSLEPTLILAPDDSTLVTTDTIAHSAAARIGNAAARVVPLIATGRPSVEIERRSQGKSRRPGGYGCKSTRRFRAIPPRQLRLRNCDHRSLLRAHLAGRLAP